MVKDIIPEHKIIFINTSNETHFTYQYVKKNYPECVYINPEEGFYTWVKRVDFIPTKFRRSCCGIYKEGNIGKYLNDDKKILQFLGMRKSESRNRSTYTTVLKNNNWNKKQLINWNFYLPILEFDDLDVWSYLFYNDIEFNQLYRFGYGRVGCTKCPFRTDYELELDRKFLPKYDATFNILLEKVFKSKQLWTVMNITLKEYIDGGWRSGYVEKEDNTDVIKEFAEHKGITFEEASKYFTRHKCKCGKSLKSEVIALNMKLLGRNTTARMCLNCLGEFVGATKKQLKEQIQTFKESGCNLF